MRIGVRHIEAGGIGYSQGYTTLEGFFSASFNQTWVPFLDVRGHLFNNGKAAANAGMGLRYVNCSGVWGGNLYYDYRKTKREHYNQIAAGLEFLSRCVDVRLNGYLPVGNKQSAFWGSEFDHFQGHFAFLRGKREVALKGANAEVAGHFFSAKNVGMGAGIGPYYLAGKGRVTWGGQARVQLDLFTYCQLSGYLSYDGLFGWRAQGQIGIVIPFGGKRKLKNCRPNLAMRSVQSVDRFEIIPVDNKKSLAKAVDPMTGDPYVFWFVDNTSHSLGTFESPFSTLVAAEQASGPGDVIYVFPGDGTSTGMDAGITLQDNQFLLGAGVNQVLEALQGTLVIPPQAVGLPSLIAPLGSSVVSVANQNMISGFEVTADANGINSGSYCIGSEVGTTQNLCISQNILRGNNGAIGVAPHEPSGQVIITNNIIQSGDSQGIYGIYLSQTSGEGFYTIEDNLLSNFQNMSALSADIPSGTAIALLTQDQSSLVISGNQIDYCVGYGMDCHAFGTNSPVLSAVIRGNSIQGDALFSAGMRLFSDDHASLSFQLLDNQTQECVFGIIAEAEGSSRMSGLMENNLLSSGPLGSGISLNTNRLTQSQSATGFFKLISNNISRFGDAQGVATAAFGSSSLTVSIEKNQMQEMGRAGVFCNGFNASSTRLVIVDNLISNNNGGMEIDSFDDATLSVRVQDNLIIDNNGAGLFAQIEENSRAKYEIYNNTFMGNNILNLNSGSAVTMIVQDAANGCLRLQNNQSTFEVTQPDYDLENTGSGRLNVEPLLGNVGTIEQSGTTPVFVGFCGP